MIIFQMFFGFIFCCFLCLKLPSIVIFLGHLIQFLRWKIVDFRKAMYNKKHGIVEFKPYGVEMFCGSQGSGKTIGIAWYLIMLMRKYPKAKVYTNFNFIYQTAPLKSMNDLIELRNGDDGVIFALDEIQNEFSSKASKDFPETLLGEITMQRKQHIVVVCSSQVFTRVAKPLREQCYKTIDCRTFMGRWTRMKCYSSDEYNALIDSKDFDRKRKIPTKWKRSFIQTDELRNSYDTYEKVKRLSREGFKANADPL